MATLLPVAAGLVVGAFVGSSLRDSPHSPNGETQTAPLDVEHREQFVDPEAKKSQ